MNRLIKVEQVLLVAIVLGIISIVSFAFGKYWLNPLAISLSAYYLLFITNCFYNVDENKSSLIRLILRNHKIPMYTATLTLVLVIFLKKSNQVIDFESTYASIITGLIAGIIGILTGSKTRKSINWCPYQKGLGKAVFCSKRRGIKTANFT